MIRLKLVALVKNIPLNIKHSMRRAKKCSSPVPRCRVMQWCAVGSLLRIEP